LVAAIALCAAAGAARAHDQPYSYLDLRIERGVIEGRVMAHVVELAHELKLETPDSLLDLDFVARRLEAVHAVFASRLEVLADARRLAPRWESGFELETKRKSVACRFRLEPGRSPGTLHVAGPLFAYDPQHETYVNVYEGGRLRLQGLLDDSRPALDYYTGSSQGTLAVVRTFVAQGAHHIFIGPDHILFIVGLMLLGGSLPRLIKIVTGFTIAHSITLALAALEIVNPPPRLIEPAIALSIVVVGADNLLRGRRGRDARAGIAFGFGFVHGFGFAGVLREFGLPPQSLGWSLLAFNLGVEIGQACIVLAVAPLLALIAARRPRLSRLVVAAGAASVVAAGSYWLVRRVFGA